MIIISHRGFWKDKNEKNSKIAFIRSFDIGLGTETDLRDYNGNIVISHDIPNGNEITFEELLIVMNNRNLPLALNIKADGLWEKIKYLLEKYNHTNYFTFDMSIPELIYQIKNGAKIFSPMSDILEKPILLDDCIGIWLDSFYNNWYDHKIIDNFLINKYVCIVSEDLHNRDVKEQWKLIKFVSNIKSSKLMLCTDKVEEALLYFKEEIN